MLCLKKSPKYLSWLVLVLMAESVSGQGEVNFVFLVFSLGCLISQDWHRSCAKTFSFWHYYKSFIGYCSASFFSAFIALNYVHLGQ